MNDYTDELRAALGVSRALLDAYVPERAVFKCGNRWSARTITGTSMVTFHTKRAAVVAAKAHKAIKTNMFERPSDYADIYRVRASKRIEFATKLQSQGMSEMAAYELARDKFPEPK